MNYQGDYSYWSRVALACDDAWQAELVRLFGKNAGDARYDARGKSTDLLRELMEKKKAADSAMARAPWKHTW